MVQKYYEKRIKRPCEINSSLGTLSWYLNVTLFRHRCISSSLTPTPVAREGIGGGACALLKLQPLGFYQQKYRGIHALSNDCSSCYSYSS